MSDAIFLRFDEPDTEVLPSDSAESLRDMRADDTATLPEVVSGFVGFAREFVADNATGLRSIDVEPGSSLLTRTMSVQAILRWDIDDQAASGQPGTIVCRGRRGSASERVAYALELRVVNAAARIGEVRWYWEDLDGNRHTAIGGQFRIEAANGYMLLTATRRCVSSSEVVVRYYVGGTLLNEAIETQGVIGGGTTGTTTVGGRITDGDDTWADHLDGAIDELRVVDRELAAEEIAATWDRISIYQPRGHQLVLDCLPPGWPTPTEADTRAGKELKLIGHSLGYAAAQAENLRANVLPDRSYGEVQERWEAMTRQYPRPGDDLDTRRARVMGHLRQRAGVSPPGVRTVLRDLLAINTEQVEVIAFDNTIRDPFDEMKARRWRISHDTEWSVGSGELKLLVAPAPTIPAASFPTTWRTCMTGVDGPERVGGYGAQIFSKLSPTQIPDGVEAGIMLYDWPRQDVLLLGLRRDGSDYKVVSQRFLAAVAQAAVVHATTSLAPHWLHILQQPITYTNEAPSDLVPHTVRWSTTGPSSGLSQDATISFSFSVGWCGMYARSWGSSLIGDDVDVAFDDCAIRFEHGRRTLYFYALRDPDLPGTPDLPGANVVLRRLRQHHTHACAITSRDMLAGDPDSGCGLGPCGGF
ncbi:MAG: LamG-like jellyroll fold domain-containing protein [Kofleriaceae bacterium]